MPLAGIKRLKTTNVPPTLARGEFAYSFLDGIDRLYIGTGDSEVDVVGGKYFTDKLDHEPGTLTANSAILVDANGYIDLISVGNVNISEDVEIVGTVTANNIVAVIDCGSY